ncbi:hypothetical protein ACFS07_23975 [Undibacterium arcticum]
MMKPISLAQRLLMLSFPILAGGFSAHAATLPERTKMSLIGAAAASAQQRCYEFMHEDADEYVSCIDALDNAVGARSANASYRRLGINYFGWVGANNSARLSLPGAEAAAQHYLPRFRKQQRQLGIADAALCPSVAGDCRTRLAQIKAMELEISQLAASRRVLTKQANRR